MRTIPIRVRVAAAFAAAMTLVFLGTGWLLHARLGSHLDTTHDQQLRLRAQDLTALVREQDNTLSATAESGFVGRDEHYAQLLDADRDVVDATPPLGRVPLLTPRQHAAASRDLLFAELASVPGLDEPSRLLATPIEIEGQPKVLVVGATVDDRNETLARLRAELLVAGPIALALATLAGYLLAGVSLRPVESMRSRAAAISAEKPGQRLPVPPTRDEIERLGVTLNAMLARLEEALERERDFVADAGHELRTPLALLRTELELALRQAKTPEELREALRSSSREADRLSQLAEDLLLIARSDRGRLELRVERVGVGDLFAAVLSRFEWRAEDGSRPLEANAPADLRVDADRLRLEQALANLVDNALRYGDGPVSLSAKHVDGAVELHVTDRGPGFPPDFLDRAFERFSRSDPARGSGGAGLGLAIVLAIARAHGGTAKAANSPEGGSDVWISLSGEAAGGETHRLPSDELGAPA